jgi:transposase
MVLNVVFWRTRSGSPWRDLPRKYGHWKTVCNRHRRWSGDGTWVRVLAELRRGADQAEGPEWTVGVDAAVVRAHQHAAGARHEQPADVAAEVVAATEVDTGGRVELQEAGR